MWGGGGEVRGTETESDLGYTAWRVEENKSNLLP